MGVHIPEFASKINSKVKPPTCVSFCRRQKNSQRPEHAGPVAVENFFLFYCFVELHMKGTGSFCPRTGKERREEPVRWWCFTSQRCSFLNFHIERKVSKLRNLGAKLKPECNVRFSEFAHRPIIHTKHLCNTL